MSSFLDKISPPNHSCFSIQKCPSTQYFKCKAFADERNCWEIPDVPCCKRNDKRRCLNCSVYFVASKKDILPLSAINPSTIKTESDNPSK